MPLSEPILTQFIDAYMRQYGETNLKLVDINATYAWRLGDTAQPFICTIRDTSKWRWSGEVWIYEDFGAKSMYLRQGSVIESHRILLDAITDPCPRYLPLSSKCSYWIFVLSSRSWQYQMLCYMSTMPTDFDCSQNQMYSTCHVER